jgi:hypothetical protein
MRHDTVYAQKNDVSRNSRVVVVPFAKFPFPSRLVLNTWREALAVTVYPVVECDAVVDCYSVGRRLALRLYKKIRKCIVFAASALMGEAPWPVVKRTGSQSKNSRFADAILPGNDTDWICEVKPELG